MMEDFKMGVLYTDATTAEIDGKTFTKVGSAREWAAYIKAGYVVNSHLRPFRGRVDTYGLTMIAPELGRYVAMLRDEETIEGTTVEDYVTYCNHHADYFTALRARQVT